MLSLRIVVFVGAAALSIGQIYLFVDGISGGAAKVDGGNVSGSSMKFLQH